MSIANRVVADNWETKPDAEGKRSYEANRQKLALLKILALGQTQIEQRKFSDIGDAFVELNEADRKETTRRSL